MTAYLMTVAMGIPLSGWLAERLGARRVFCLAIAIFTVASLLCALSQDLTMLTLSRVLQGAGGAMMVPVGTLVVLRGTPKEDLLRATAYLVWPGLLAPVLAPLVGGALTTYPVLALDLPDQPPAGRWRRSWPRCAWSRPSAATSTGGWTGWGWPSPPLGVGALVVGLELASGRDSGGLAAVSDRGGRCCSWPRPRSGCGGPAPRCSTWRSLPPGRSAQRRPAASSTG